MLKITPKKIKPKWLLTGFSDYFIAEDKKMYRFSTLKEVKMVMYGYTKGYYLHRKFYALSKLRPLITKIDV